MAIKYYIDPISHDLLKYTFRDGDDDEGELVILEEVRNVRVLLAGQIVNDEDYAERGVDHARNAGRKSYKMKKKGPDFMSQSERVLDLLKEDPDMGSNEISAETGIPVDTVYSLKSNLKKKGKI